MHPVTMICLTLQELDITLYRWYGGCFAQYEDDTETGRVSVKTLTRAFFSGCSMLVLGFMLSACSLTTDPTKASSDSTSSTSGKSSKKDGTQKEEEKVSSFTTINFARLKEDMAAGQGEHLASLATLLGVPPEQQPAFFAFTKEKFAVVCSSDRVTSDEMVAALTQEMAAHPQF